MSDEDDRPKGFDEILRSIAAEVERAIDQVSRADLGDLERMGRMAGVDLDVEDIRRKVHEAGEWVRGQVEGSGERAEGGTGGWHDRTTRPAGSASDPRTDPVPSPLDLPTTAQGTALAALESGRWVVEPGARALSEPGGPTPAEAAGLYGELRVRDWLDLDGAVTTTGQAALRRWLAAAERAADDAGDDA
ncbi:MAG: hypothetical protein M0P31_13935 [Solirubrobacteraceae bacterium]|nr:hypothetical protein [Solirubrobacteraceae bacterium]